jgi:hypothetical protein
MMRQSWMAVLFVGLMTQCPVQAEVTMEQQPDKVTVKLDGELFTEYLIKSGVKPVLWPIIGPGGKKMTRSYPMENVKGEAKDHPHQRSLWFTHGSVNGVDFWVEIPPQGSIVHKEFVKVEGGERGVIVTRNDWVDKSGKKILEDERTFTFHGTGDKRFIDCDVTLKATEEDVKFGDTKEGSFGVRVAAPLEVRRKQGGKIINSEGQADGEAWGKPARWVDYHGPIDGEVLGVAILNHPKSFRHPTHWHVRDYGLFAANVFGLHDFQGSEQVDGSHVLPKGESLTFRHRVLLHKGDEVEAGVPEAFTAYSQEP